MPSALTVSINANTSGLVAEAAVAEAAIRKMTTAVRADARSLASSFDAVRFDRLKGELENLGGAQNRLAGLNEEIKRLGADGPRAWSLNRIGMLEMQAAGINSFQAVAAGMDPLRVAMMEGSQVIGALVQGGVVGFAALLSPIGLLSAAALAAGGAIGYMAFRAYETRQALGGMQAELLLTGRTGAGSIDDAGKSAENLAKKFDLSKLAAAELLAEVAKARTLSADQIRQVAELAAAEGRVRRGGGEDVKDIDIAKKMAAALADGAGGAIKLAQSYNIATAAAEQMLKSGNEIGAFRTAIADIAAHIRSHGGAWAEAKTKYDEYKSAVEKFFNLPPMAAQLFGMALPSKPTDRPSRGTGIDAGKPVAYAPIPSDAETALLAEIRRRESGGRYDIFHANRAVVSSLADVRAFPGKSHAFGAYGFQPGTYEAMAKEMGFDPNDISPPRQDQAALQLLRKYGPNATQSWAASGPYSTISDTSSAETEFAAKTARERAARDVEQAHRIAEIENRNSLQRQIAEAQAFYDRQTELVRAENPKITDEELKKDSRIEAAQLDLNQKRAQLYDQDTARAIAALREQQAKATEISARIPVQRQIIGTLEARGAPVTEVDAARTELAALERQMGQETIQRREEQLGRARQMGQQELQTFAAQEQLKVALGRETAGEAVKAEAAKQDALLAAQKAGLEKLVSDFQLTGKQAEKFGDQIKSIDLERAARQAQAATREAEANKALLEKWIAPVKQAFDSIGSTIEGAISGILTRQKTWAGAFKEIENSVISSVVSGAGGILSKLGAKSIFGATQGEGLGEAMFNSLAKQFNLGDLLGIGTKATGDAAGAAAITGAGAAFSAEVTAAGAAFAASVTAASATSGATSAAGGLASGGGGIFSLLSGAAFAFSRGGIVPSAAGGWALPSFAGAQPALLHSREMVLPAQISEGLQSAIAGGGLGGGPMVINLSAIDLRSGAQFLMSHSDTIARSLSRARRNFQPA